METIEKVTRGLPQGLAMEIEQNPESIGYTNTQVQRLFSEQLRATPEGEVKSFQEEFPVAFKSLSQGLGKFE